MRKGTILFTVIALFLLIGGVGCEKDIQNDCYSGIIVSLNERNACNDIVKIDKSIDNGLSVGTNLAFYSGLFDRKLEIGETIYFKVLSYEKWVGPANASCLWPHYVAQIEVCQSK
ncbi:MAG TPA: hypothetical protein GXZ87_07405 [Bacteroidales bacterium]|nr:hypothetical protein [Bacteroidales bacterium]